MQCGFWLDIAPVIYRGAGLLPDTTEKTLAFEFVQQSHVQKLGHLFFTLAKSRNEIAPPVGLSAWNIGHTISVKTIGLFKRRPILVARVVRQGTIGRFRVFFQKRDGFDITLQEAF